MVGQNRKVKGLLPAMLTLGALCGLVEVVGGNILHQSGIHLSGLLIGLDCILIGIAMALYEKPLMVIGMGLVTCAFKQLVIPVLGLSFACKANSCLAVMLEYGGLTALAAITLNGMRKNSLIRALTAGIGVFAGSIVYYFAGMRVKPCPYMLSFNVPGGLVNFIAREGLVWAAFSAVLFPLGWMVGEKSREKAVVLIEQKPQLFRLAAMLTTVVCLVASVVSIMSQN